MPDKTANKFEERMTAGLLQAVTVSRHRVVIMHPVATPLFEAASLCHRRRNAKETQFADTTAEGVV